ncbi:hypothetical protein Psi02_70610 [Planotetraspora silvatica]|uniref:Uncharacterized protein n=1 Tax=Planotetraspora silvatica TaxID=234614 RepID=A0A8J3UVJ4_9ACTN|nr:hypothetical protein Psi02_70610 [Planotetraspora silvatica]
MAARPDQRGHSGGSGGPDTPGGPIRKPGRGGLKRSPRLRAAFYRSEEARTFDGAAPGCPAGPSARACSAGLPAQPRGSTYRWTALAKPSSSLLVVIRCATRRTSMLALPITMTGRAGPGVWQRMELVFLADS